MRAVERLQQEDPTRANNMLVVVVVVVMRMILQQYKQWVPRLSLYGISKGYFCCNAVQNTCYTLK
jgi:hypothetical protein